MPDQVNRIKILSGITDREIAYMEIFVRTIPKLPTPRKFWLYNKANWTGMKDYLCLCLKRHDQAYNICVDTLWNDIKNPPSEAANMFIPRKKSKKDVCPWIDKELMKTMKTRDRVFRWSKKSGAEKAEKRYLLYESTVQTRLRSKHRAYVHNLFNTGDQTKVVLEIYQTQALSSSPNVVLLRTGNKLFAVPADKANVVNAQFVSVFSKPGSRSNCHQ